MVLQDQSLRTLQRVIDGVDVGMGQTMALGLDLHQDFLPQARVRASSPACIVRCGANFPIAEEAFS